MTSALENDLANEVRKRIFAGDYAPGQRLVEADLCRDFAASRFTVRVALQELVNDGLVELQRNKGASVRTISLEEAIEITEVRMALEALAAARAAENVTAAGAAELRETIALMRKAVAAAELLVYSDLNARLHARIRQISGNATCNRTIERLLGQMVRHQFALSLQPGRPSVSLVQHEEIVKAITRKDSGAAEIAMRHHLTSVMEALRTQKNAKTTRPGTRLDMLSGRSHERFGAGLISD